MPYGNEQRAWTYDEYVEKYEALKQSNDKLEEQVMERLRPCLHCQHTGWIHTDDDIPNQMCPYCFVGKAVIKCYDKTTKVQLGDYNKLKEKAESHDDLLAACEKFPTANMFSLFADFAEECFTKPSMAVYRNKFNGLATFLRSCESRAKQAEAVLPKAKK